MVKIKLNKILKKGRALFLAYDQGLEHGPADFNDKNVDPVYIIDIARRGKFSAVIFHKGIAEKYSAEIKKSGVPLIVKLNGKTSLVGGEPVSRMICSVDEAVKLGAVGVGYTIYIGSEFEEEMLSEFGEIVEEAHELGLPVVLWCYPRGKSLRDLPRVGSRKSEVGSRKRSKAGKLMAYAARVGLEVGADVVKIQSDGNLKDLEWAVESAGKCKVVVAGGARRNADELIRDVKSAIKSGCVGVAIGRNVWQSEEPLKLAGKLRKVVLG
ncbi:MAG: fructose-bisphosphate aldolase [Nanoarchaeota archaeon]|nr:fructose-bisphosphate aldolase [Nanoarchaeota archaeon]